MVSDSEVLKSTELVGVNSELNATCLSCSSQSITLVPFVVEEFKEIADSVCVSQRSKDGSEERVVLFLKMAAGSQFTPELVKQLRTVIRNQLSARHVPSVILEIKDIPVSSLRNAMPASLLCSCLAVFLSPSIHTRAKKLKLLSRRSWLEKMSKRVDLTATQIPWISITISLNSKITDRLHVSCCCQALKPLDSV